MSIMSFGEGYLFCFKISYLALMPILLLLFRDQSCTDILEIYNKVKAEDLSSTDEEEQVKSKGSLGNWFGPEVNLGGGDPKVRVLGRRQGQTTSEKPGHENCRTSFSLPPQKAHG